MVRLLLSHQVVLLVCLRLNLQMALIVIVFGRGSKESLEVLATTCSAVLAIIGLAADRIQFELTLDSRCQAIPLDLT